MKKRQRKIRLIRAGIQLLFFIFAPALFSTAFALSLIHIQMCIRDSHTSAEGNELAGVTFPVKVNKASDLENFKQITDSTTIEITTNMKGQVSTNTYTGAAALIEQPSYTYYVPAETPAYYKEMSVEDVYKRQLSF